MSIVEIKEFELNQKSGKVEFEIVQYVINKMAVVNCNFLDSEDKRISSVLVYISGSDFNDLWVSDDDLINICLNKLGLTRA
jgi:hypothetical protein